MKFFFLVAILSFSFLKNFAQEQKIPVGTQPAEIMIKLNSIHIFCSGFDLNDNGIVEKDLGDVAASWWIFDATTLNYKQSIVLENMFFKTAPLNVGMTRYRTFFFQNGIVYEYKTREQDFVREFSPVDSLKDIVSLYTSPEFDGDEDGIILTTLSIKPKTGIGYLSFLNRYYGTNGIVVPVGENPIQVLKYMTLNKGIIGENNSSLFRAYYDPMPTLLGDGGNFMTYHNRHDSILIVMYGSHQVHVFDNKKGEIVKTIPTQTTGFKGPRECAIDGDNLYVTTYNCDIRKFSISTGELLKIIPVSGMSDPIQVVNGKLIVGITRTCDSLPNNTISVIDITMSVENEEPFAIAGSVSPNPFKNSASISATFQPHIHSATIEIFSSSGHSIGVFKKEVRNGELNFQLQSDVLQLAQGQYMARISAGKQMSVVPFVVVR